MTITAVAAATPCRNYTPDWDEWHHRAVAAGSYTDSPPCRTCRQPGALHPQPGPPDNFNTVAFGPQL